MAVSSTKEDNRIKAVCDWLGPMRSGHQQDLPPKGTLEFRVTEGRWGRGIKSQCGNKQSLRRNLREKAGKGMNLDITPGEVT